MTTINFDNGCGMYYDAYDVDYAIIAIEGIYSDKDDIEFAEKLIGLIDRYWDEIALRMDKELAEEVHNDIAPCTNAEFLAEYLRRSHDGDGIVIG